MGGVGEGAVWALRESAVRQSIKLKASSFREIPNPKLQNGGLPTRFGICDWNFPELLSLRIFHRL